MARREVPSSQYVSKYAGDPHISLIIFGGKVLNNLPQSSRISPGLPLEPVVFTHSLTLRGLAERTLHVIDRFLLEACFCILTTHVLLMEASRLTHM